MAVELEKFFVENMAGLKPETHIDLSGVYNLFPTYEATDELGRMEKPALDKFAIGLRDIGLPPDTVEKVIGNETYVRFFAVLAQTHIFNQPQMRPK